MPGTCLYCDKRIKSGRADKKFCDDRCKDEFHNRQKIAEHKEIKRVELLLKKNRRILKKLYNPAKETLVNTTKLSKAGFDFDYHTQYVTTKLRQNVFIFCFDFGYREVKTGVYKIIERFKEEK